MSRMTIGELARRGGVGIETIRYYQRRHLLPEPPRRANGFRHYSEDNLRTLRLIRRAKGLGFTLKEIAELLPMRGRKSQLLELLVEKRNDLEKQAAELQMAIRALKRLTDDMAPMAPEERWSLLDPDNPLDI
jgi:MerR family transcriptional regulator, copper efflux regulator